MTTHPLAGKPAPRESLIDVGMLRNEYYGHKPDITDHAQRVHFGTGGHRGSSLRGAFNEAHVLAVSQAICDFRATHGIAGPVYIGRDTHALSEPAFTTALEVLAANNVEARIDRQGGYTPTPAISHAIIRHNLGRTAGLADGIVLTSSHNPPEDGGIKYNPPHGGPAGTDVTRWVEDRANWLLSSDLRNVARIAYERARRAATTQPYDYVESYVADLASVIDMDVVRNASLRVGVDSLGGTGAVLWRPIAERYGIDLVEVHSTVDPTFRFMPLDWDGKIRMDCSSSHAMAALVAVKDEFDIAFGNDPDADRYGIVTRSAGLMNSNHSLAAAAHYLFTRRSGWPSRAAIGKTIVTSSIIDRVAARIRRGLVEVPVGFKWFVPGLLDGTLGFASEESAGASFLRRDGSVWVTDKDGIIMNLLAIEMMARTGRDPSELYAELAEELGAPLYERIDAAARDEEKAVLLTLSARDIRSSELAGEPIEAVLTVAPGNGAPIGGLKVVTAQGWFAARPSGTAAVYKLYAESFRGIDHLRQLQTEAQAMISEALAGVMG